MDRYAHAAMLPISTGTIAKALAADDIGGTGQRATLGFSSTALNIMLPRAVRV